MAKKEKEGQGYSWDETPPCHSSSACCTYTTREEWQRAVPTLESLKEQNHSQTTIGKEP